MSIQDVCVELLHEIFLLAAEDHFTSSATYVNNSKLHSYISPSWSISHTCRRFRSIALSIPRLWSFIRVDFSLIPLEKDKETDSSQYYPIHKLYLHLQRSKKTGLRIFFRTPIAGVSRLVMMYALGYLEILAGHKERWKKVDFCVASPEFLNLKYWNLHVGAREREIAERVLGRLFVGQFETLERLRVVYPKLQGREGKRVRSGLDKLLLPVEVKGEVLRVVKILRSGGILGSEPAKRVMKVSMLFNDALTEV